MRACRQARPAARAAAVWLLVAVMATGARLLPRIAQPPQYHRFADPYVCFGTPHCLDIGSNLLFLLAGAAGLRYLAASTGSRAFIAPAEAWPYRVLFLAVFLVGLGSAYYHLAPDNPRLVWDRAPLALALMAWLGANVCERASLKAGLRLLPLLLIVGPASVGYWAWSEARGSGDLRPYLLIQACAIVVVPLLLCLYAPRYTGDRDVLAITGCYVLALVCDVLDHQIAALTGLVSGHTLKHVIAALAVYGVVLRLKRRRLVEAGT
ncbi:hypothetical protein [Cupriavidus consociatus]|uniref:hypothetical protein n=1 Tax=Cupriavidus consociatus TaxID=2821357 RepID=UPI001AEA82DF|nr:MULTISPECIES: hypothetical protein [unclassified Cupriavidus]MBP0625028.1 hypothetical protein [Cupriavidus sp. LEh25]MDK2661763.1 hypothetical protein [Cupriavidus sp. LEh21]